MNKYPKIETLFKRNPATDYKTVIIGEYSKPEFEYLELDLWEFTEKVDGTNIRLQVLSDQKQIVIKGRSDKAQIPSFLMTALENIVEPVKDQLFEMFPKNACLYGEGYGSKIQKGGKYRSDWGFILFDIKVGRWWLKQPDVRTLANDLNFEHVPVIGNGILGDLVRLVDGGLKSEWGDFEAEGIVARPNVDLYARNGERIITKLKCEDFRR